MGQVIHIERYRNRAVNKRTLTEAEKFLAIANLHCAIAFLYAEQEQIEQSEIDRVLESLGMTTERVQ